MARIAFNSNIDALRAIGALDRASKLRADTLERLSSGLRINSARDDAAGLSISMQLRANSRILSQAARNANDGISLLNIAEGSLNQLSSILQRMNELAEQSANGSFSNRQRITSQAEVQALTDEFNRIVGATSFNGQQILSADFSRMNIQVGTGNANIIGLSTTDEFAHAAGTGSFTAQATISLGSSSSIINEMMDVNGDGNLDILLNSGTAVTYMAGNGAGSFAAATTLFSTGSTSGVPILADIDGDGDKDFVVGAANGTVYSWKNLGAGSFGAQQSISTGYSSSVNGLRAGDINGDGNMDILALHQNSSHGTSVLFASNSPGNFSVGQSLNFSNSQGPDIGDIDGDGYGDILTNSSGAIFARRWNGSSFDDPRVLLSGSISAYKAADFNNDGRTDLIAFDGSTAQLALQSSSGGFSVSSSVAAVFPTGIITQDINNDGFLDIVAAAPGTNQALTLINSGQGSFSNATPSTTMSPISNAFVGDVNSDGVSDIVIASSTLQSLRVLMQGETSLTSLERIDVSTRSGAREALDLIQEASNRVRLQLSVIGSAQSRLDAALATVFSSRDNYESAAARILDADMAMEASAATRGKILEDISSAVLAQANQAPRIALDLLLNAGRNSG